MPRVNSLQSGEIEFSESYEEVPSSGLNLRHCHETYEILYVIKGTGRYLVEGVSYEMKPGTLILVRPYQYHCVEVTPDAPYERYVVHFPATSVSADAAKALAEFREEGARCRYHAAGGATRMILGAFERFELGKNLPDEKRSGYMSSVLSEILLLLSVEGAAPAPEETEELGLRVIRYLDANIEKDLSLDRVARHFFVSKYYLCRAFKKHNGISIHGYLTKKRVLYAKQLIENGETASGAAYAVGFGDYSAFYRAYTRQLGTSPADARKSGESETQNV